MKKFTAILTLPIFLSSVVTFSFNRLLFGLLITKGG